MREFVRLQKKLTSNFRNYPLKNLYKKNPQDMSISKRVQDVFNRFNVNLTVNRTDLTAAALENGTVIYTDADAFAEGVEVYIINDEGERIPLPPGDYTLADGSVLSIGEGGVVLALTPAAEEAPAEAPAEVPVAELQEEELASEDKKDEEDKEEMQNTAITREEVAVMIAEAIAALSDPKAEEVAEEVAVAEGVEAELSALKAELSEMKKQAAEKGLAHAAPTPKAEPINLSTLSITERVQALHNQFSK